MNALPDLDPVPENPEVRVADVMHWGLVSCAADAPLDVVAALMIDELVHCVVVMDGPSDDSSLWGVVSDLDLIAAASVRALAEQKAGGSAMRPAVTIDPAASLESAARAMTRAGVAHLVVVDPVERRPVGVLSTLDLAGALASNA
jgi:CBS domain-containing protein